MTTPVTNTNTTPPAASTTGSSTASANTPAQAQQSLSGNYNDFLKLLTTQLQNQDPTSPADTNQITQEIAMLSEVQQTINTNTNLQQLISLYTASQTTNAVGYIGTQVDATGNQGNLANGVGTFAYNLPAGTSTAKVTITNSAGATVFSGSGTTLAGRNQVLWNGTNNTTGAQMPDGTYNFTVTATDANGKALTATTLTTGTVTAVDTQNGVATLSLGNNISVPLSGVQSVRTPPAVTNSGTGTAASAAANAAANAAAKTAG